MGGSPRWSLGCSRGQWYPIWSWNFCSLCEYSYSLFLKMKGFLMGLLSPKLSSMIYLIESYGAGAAASGKFLSYILSR